jgi:signal transduction histidine kinase
MLGAVFCAYSYSVMRPVPGRLSDDKVIVLVLIFFQLFASCVLFFSSTLLRFRVALGIRAIALLLLVSSIAGATLIEVVLVGCFVAETAIYEPFPRNLWIGGGVFLACLLARLFVFLGPLHRDLPETLLEEGGFLLFGVLLLLPASLFTKYREDIIAVQQDKKRLDGMVMELAKANLQYQDFAAEASEAGMRDERLRITRDIHDVVGYTLTNNIAMMEAATDMMRRSPLGVPALINAARDNAQEGLQQIREALYRLRAQAERGPRGLRAVTRLCQLFEKATRIRVKFAYGNSRWEYGDALDSAIYHLVQEALLNAFRHGKPAHATVALWEKDSSVTVAITDDGTGAEVIHEGIGLRGMRERIEALGGRLQVSPRPGAFSVQAWVPLAESHDGG